MGYPDELLSRGERVVLHKHPHWKVLVFPLIFFLLIIGGGAALAAVLRNWNNDTGRQISWIAIAVVAVVLAVFLCVVPFLRWRTEHFVITNHHVFFRTGILHRRQHQIPLSNVQNIETTVPFWGRLLGYGSLIVESAADQPLEFENVASLTKVQAVLNQLIMDDRAHGGHHPAGQPLGPGPGGPPGLGGSSQYPEPGGYSQYPEQGSYPEQGTPQQGYQQPGHPQHGYQPPEGYAGQR